MWKKWWDSFMQTAYGWRTEFVTQWIVAVRGYIGYRLPQESHHIFHIRNRSKHSLVNVCTTPTDVLPDDGTVRSVTCRSLMFFLMEYCELNDSCVCNCWFILWKPTFTMSENLTMLHLWQTEKEIGGTQNFTYVFRKCVHSLPTARTFNRSVHPYVGINEFKNFLVPNSATGVWKSDKSRYHGYCQKHVQINVQK